MTNPTPGPWCCVPFHYPGQDRRPTVRSEPGKCEVARVSEQYQNRAERIANAHLIAASPCLLAALREALVVLEAEQHHTHPTLNTVRAAIARAEGRAS